VSTSQISSALQEEHLGAERAGSSDYTDKTLLLNINKQEQLNKNPDHTSQHIF